MGQPLQKGRCQQGKKLNKLSSIALKELYIELTKCCGILIRIKDLEKLFELVDVTKSNLVTYKLFETLLMAYEVLI